MFLGENSVFFVADEAITPANYTQVLLGNKDQLSMTWPYDEIREIHKRWYQLRDNALEIFLTNGRTCLLACEKKWVSKFSIIWINMVVFYHAITST